jgi:heptosyltransferase-2
LSYRKILIRVPNWLGDTMMSTPAVSEVIKLFPKAEITILCKPTFAGFWSKFPGVDGVLTLEKGIWPLKGIGDLKKFNFDAALILPASFSSAFSIFAAGIPVRIGWASEGRSPFLTQAIINERPRQKHLVWEYLDLVREGFGKKISSRTFRLEGPRHRGFQGQLKKLGWNSKGKKLALVPGATYGQAKRWPLDQWKELMTALLKSGKDQLIVLGGPEEEEYLTPLRESLSRQDRERVLWLVGQTDTQTLSAVLAECDLLITNDTGPMHVAAAVGTPVVALFGSTSPVWTGPFGKGHEILHKQVECSPCFQKTCPIGYICLERITVKEVLETVRKRLGRPLRVLPETPPRGVWG